MRGSSVPSLALALYLTLGEACRAVGEAPAHELTEAGKNLLEASDPRSLRPATIEPMRPFRSGVTRQEIRLIVQRHQHLPDPGMMPSERDRSSSVKWARSQRQRGVPIPLAWERRYRQHDVPLPGFEGHWKDMDQAHRKYASKLYRSAQPTTKQQHQRQIPKGEKVPASPHSPTSSGLWGSIGESSTHETPEHEEQIESKVRELERLLPGSP